MRYRTLRSAGFSVSVIGFGGWGIGGRTVGATSYGSTDDAVSRRALEAAFDQGITFYDTANAYGNGHSEELIGEVFRGRRDQIVIATKAGMLPSYAGTDFSPPALRASLEGSLRRLGTDYIDILQLHNPPPADIQNRPEILSLLRALCAEGKIRAFGFSTKSPADALQLVAVSGVASLQVNLNLLDWRAVDNGVLAEAERQGVGIIARTPLAFGFLSGDIAADRTFHSDDHRSLLGPAKVRAMVTAAHALLAAASARDCRARVAAALRFCLSFSAVVTVIPGMLNEREVALNAAAGEVEPFTAAELECLKDVYRLHESDLVA